MKATKLLNKLKGILSDEYKAQMKKYDSLKKVLKSLRAEKRRLKKELSQVSDKQQREEIRSQLKIVSEQRKKGLQVLRELKERKNKPG